MSSIFVEVGALADFRDAQRVLDIDCFSEDAALGAEEVDAAEVFRQEKAWQ